MCINEYSLSHNLTFTEGPGPRHINKVKSITLKQTSLYEYTDSTTKIRDKEKDRGEGGDGDEKTIQRNKKKCPFSSYTEGLIKMSAL